MPIEQGSGAPSETASGDVFYISSEVLGGREVKPGDTVTLTVAEIGDGELGLTYAEPKEAPEGEYAEPDDMMLRKAFPED
jgi:hypothetical protein